jgi:hypothetical protein
MLDAENHDSQIATLNSMTRHAQAADPRPGDEAALPLFMGLTKVLR